MKVGDRVRIIDHPDSKFPNCIGKVVKVYESAIELELNGWYFIAFKDEVELVTEPEIRLNLLADIHRT